MLGGREKRGSRVPNAECRMSEWAVLVDGWQVARVGAVWWMDSQGGGLMPRRWADAL